jgi:hypothetical protein
MEASVEATVRGYTSLLTPARFPIDAQSRAPSFEAEVADID